MTQCYSRHTGTGNTRMSVAVPLKNSAMKILKTS